MTREEHIKEILVSILRVIEEGTERVQIEDTDCGKLYFPIMRYFLEFEFTDEDIQLIKSLGEEMGEDFSMLTES